MKERPTGIIRTLPSLYADPENIGRKRYEASIKALEQEKLPAIYIALQAIPKVEVLHIYLLIEGEVKVRLNIAGYEPGSAQECWDRNWQKASELRDELNGILRGVALGQTDRAQMLDQVMAIIRREQKAAPCPHVIAGTEGTGYCQLAEQHGKDTARLNLIESRMTSAPAEIAYADGSKPNEEAVCWRMEDSLFGAPGESFRETIDRAIREQEPKQ